MAAWFGPHAYAPNVAAKSPHVLSRTFPFDSDWLLVKTLLDEKCVGCHRSNGERWNFATYDALLEAGEEEDDTRAVVPGKLGDSLLWEYVDWNVEAREDTDSADTPMMPPLRDHWLTKAQLNTVQRWIEKGAPQYVAPPHCGPRPLAEYDFPSAKQCRACHPRQYDQWSRSMHAYAQHSPVFEAFNLTLLERTGGTIGTFCSRCHTPVGTSLGENGLVRNVDRSRLSMEGVTCVACHRRSVGAYKSSGRIAIEPGDLRTTCMYGPFESSVANSAKTHPTQRFAYIKQSQFCGECHDVTSPQGVRLEEAFSEWNHSPAARDGVTCQSCHMGPVQGRPCPDSGRPLGRAAVVPGLPEDRLPLRRLSDHTFAGPDYSLLPDTEFPEKLDWMYEIDYRDRARLTPLQRTQLEDLRRENRASLAIYREKRAELLRNSARIRLEAPKTIRPGAALVVRVSVRSLTAGHSLPTGFTAERQVWVEVVVRDPKGAVVYASGDVDHNGDLRDEHSHAVLAGRVPADRDLLNFQNKFIALGNKGTERSVVLSVNRNLTPVNVLRPADVLAASFGRPPGFRIAKGSLPPLQSVKRRYATRATRCPGDYTITARLNFRHLPPALLDHIGTPHLKRQLEVFVIDEAVGSTRVQ